MIDGISSSMLPERNPRFVNQAKLLSEVSGRVLATGAGNQTVVLTGAPGSGKTAAGIELAHRLRGYYPDGGLFLEFSGAVDPADSIGEMLGKALLGLGLRESDIPDRPGARQQRFQALTAGRSYVLLLDGVVSAQQVRALRPGPGSSLTLVTEARPVASAESAEVPLIVVEPLDADATRDMLSGSVGADLLAAEPEAAAAIVGLCEGLPMAVTIVAPMIRRAALRTRNPLAETVERLRDERRRRTLMPMDMVFGAAYRALSEPARRGYRALGLRAHGGVISAPALAAALEMPEYEAAETLIELAESHLIEPRRTDRDVPHDGGRFTTRELVRAHARDLDEPTDDRVAAERRLLHHYDRHLCAADALLAPSRPWRALLFPELDTAPGVFEDAASAREWLRAERIAVRAAADHAADVGSDELVMRWCVLLWPFHEKEKFTADLRALHRLGIAAARRHGNRSVESLLHTQLGFAHYWLRELDSAATEFDDGVRTADRQDLEATALEGLGLTRLAQERVPEARGLLRRNANLARAIGDPRRLTLAAFHRAKAEVPAVALPLLERAATGFAAEPADETENLAKVRYWRGRKRADRGELDSAAEDLGYALEVMTDRGRGFDMAEIFAALGAVSLARADAASARSNYRRALELYEQLGFGELAQRCRTELEGLPSA
ncbi:NB-ARC domain-containing protein [Nocardia seriolae]|uniref:NB-ARC domain-containing protein n=1 Tax=Nocardia seriolae TaxID=37332 RepID=UPI0009DD3D15|nr:NB-ARC domain-containing protein [Nocardia seriolae]MTJ63492.1 hypothetical protein [Nocardia seriolae]MTJ76392.1 hypothetical protein [Nocardia seriolae]MTJ88709.1 hypothetical protein [Nocardia seriolae]MTK32688.1 hypothetical protein [Nocardia seriolae]MTK41391.1 hypothetical protein [Nocardia seriolae]